MIVPALYDDGNPESLGQLIKKSQAMPGRQLGKHHAIFLVGNRALFIVDFFFYLGIHPLVKFIGFRIIRQIKVRNHNRPKILTHHGRGHGLTQNIHLVRQTQCFIAPVDHFTQLVIIHLCAQQIFQKSNIFF